jgi:hypothetical protein
MKRPDTRTYKSAQRHVYLDWRVGVSRRFGFILMTFLLLSVPLGLANVKLERVVGVLVESYTPSENDAPVPVADSRHILVDNGKRGAATGRRPQP